MVFDQQGICCLFNESMLNFVVINDVVIVVWNNGYI